MLIFTENAENQKNPRAHKIKLALPPPPAEKKKIQIPPQDEKFYGHGGLILQKNPKSQVPIKRAEFFMDTGLFLRETKDAVRVYG